MAKTVNPVWVSGHYKLIDRSNDTSVANWVFKNQDTAWTQTADALNVGVVFGWGESAAQTTGTASGVITLQYDINSSGTWTTVTGTTAVQTANSAAVTDGGTYSTAYTTAPTGVASWGGTGEYDENNSATSRTPVDQYFEALFVLALDSAQLANGDVITFRILHGGATFNSTDATPTLTYYEAVLNNYVVDCLSGSYTYTGQSATIDKSKLLVANAGAYTYTGQSATITWAQAANNYVVDCLSGSYTYTGQSATLTRSYQVGASAGSYTVTGQSATIERDRYLVANAGSYAYTGQSATITYTGITPAYIVDCLPGSYSITGQNATIERDRRLTAQPGSYTYTGQDATLSKTTLNHYTLDALAGSYVYTGQSASIARNRNLTANAGSYVYTGQSANITRTIAGAYEVICQPGSYAVTGQSAQIVYLSNRAEGGGIGHGKKQRKRYIIKDRLYTLTDDELREVLAQAFRKDEKVEVKKPSKRLIDKAVAQQKPRKDEGGRKYIPLEQIVQWRAFALPPDDVMQQAIAWAILKKMDEDEDDIEVLLMVA